MPLLGDSEGDTFVWDIRCDHRLMRRSRISSLLVVMLCLSLVVSSFSGLAGFVAAAAGIDPVLTVHFFDVAQGDAVLVQGEDFTILIDAGRHDRSDVVQ